MHILSTQDITIASHLLRSGEIVAFPTETVYGLGAAIFNPSAIRKIFQAKNRPSDNPLIAHVADLGQVEEIAHSLPKEFFLLAERFWPGPLTILLSKRDEVPLIASAGLSRIGVRMPAHPIALALIKEVQEPLVAPSANLSGKPSATCLSHILRDFEGKIAAVVDGGPCQIGLESTVLDLENLEILRPGIITKEEIETLMRCKIGFAKCEGETPRSPGMKYRHYAPIAKVDLFTDLAELEQQWNPECCVLAPPGTFLQCPYQPLLPQTLYAELRSADEQKKDRVLIFCDEKIIKNIALMNRLVRSCQTIEHLA